MHLKLQIWTKPSQRSGLRLIFPSCTLARTHSYEGASKNKVIYLSASSPQCTLSVCRH